jgi:peptide/nickel transport system substrate-binding protein
MSATRRDILKLLGSGAVLSVLPATLAAQTATKFVFATNAPYDTIDPHAVFDASRAGVRFNLYDGLYRYVDNPPKLVPWLAKSHEVSADRLSYVFNLREDAVFHDGKPVTADDVVYSIERILALKKGPAALYIDVLSPGSTKALDARTVQFNLKAPSAIFLATVPDIAVVNSALARRYEVDNDWSEKWLGRNDAGSGSYRLTDFDPTTGWSARRFPNHFVEFGSQPIEEIQFRNVTETNTRVLGLIKGDYHGSDGFMPFDQIERLRRSNEVQIIEEESMRVFLFALNNARPPLTDHHFRRALAYAFDYDGYIQNVMKNSVTRNPGPLPVTMWGSPPDLKGYTFDLKKAEQELKKVELPLRPLLINALAGHSETEQAAILFQSTLKKIGIETNIEVSPWPVVANRLATLDTRPDIVPIWKSTFYLDPNNWVGEGYGTRYHGQRSLSYYSNPEFDKRLDRALVSDSHEERRALYEEMTQMVVDDSAGIFVYNTRWHGPYSKRVSGIRFSPVNNGQDLRWATMKAG